MLARLSLLVLLVAGCEAPTTSTSDEALTCDLGSPDGFGNACVKAASPTPINAFTATSRTKNNISANNNAYGVHLVAVSGGNGGMLGFTPLQSGTYVIYLGTPNIPLTVHEVGASDVHSQCTTTITASECASLRRVTTYDLLANHSYTINFGPTTVSYVRLYVQTETAAPAVCTADQLAEETAACTAADQGSQPLAAAALGTSPTPALALDAVYTVTLPSTGGTSYGGAFSFTPDTGGTYELYLGTPNLPLRVIDDDSSVEPMSCSRYIASSECDRLRRGDLFALREGDQVRFELGPNASTHYVRVTIRKQAAAQSTVKLGTAGIYPSGAAASWLTTGDLNGDGALDFAVSSPDDASGDNEVDIMPGTGGGTFSVATTIMTSAPSETQIADFNRDGTLDVVGIAWDGQGPLTDFYLQGTGSFMYTKTAWGSGRDFLRHLSSGDFDDDGTPELVAAYVDTEFGTGAAGFAIIKMPANTVSQDESAFGADTNQAIAGDFNGDGHQDVVASSKAASAVRLYLGNGSGTVAFATEVALPGAPIKEIGTADFNGDELSDLVAIHTDQTVTVSFGTATGFAAPQVLLINNAFARGIAAGDFDHDGMKDLAIGAADDQTTIAIFTGTASGFARAATLAAPQGVGYNLAVGDYNGDGFDDLATTSASSITVYLSTP